MWAACASTAHFSACVFSVINSLSSFPIQTNAVYQNYPAGHRPLFFRARSAPATAFKSLDSRPAARYSSSTVALQVMVSRMTAASPSGRMCTLVLEDTTSTVSLSGSSAVPGRDSR